MSADQPAPANPTDGSLETPAAAALTALFLAHRVVSESMDRALREVSGLSKAQIEVLILLTAAPDGRLRMADITQAICVSRSGTTQIVDRLVAAGLVTRVGGHYDRRVIWTEINEAGRTVVRDSRPVFDQIAESWLGGRLTADQIIAMRDSLRALLREPDSFCH